MRQYGDGREITLLEYVYGRSDLDQLRGNPGAVLAAIDTFARTNIGLVNIGETKGKHVTSVIAQHKPATILEVGGYVGYSTILFGNAMKQAGGKRYYSVEKSPVFAAVASSLVDLAGLRDMVQFVVGTGAEGIQRLADDGVLGREKQHVGMMFFDHHKPSYTADLQRAERLGFVGKGTVLVADNMIVPGNPPYAEYVNTSVADKKAKAASSANNESMGDPGLEYSSRFIKSFEPSGMEDAIEVTECIGVWP